MHLMASVESIRQTKLLQEEQEQEQENEVSVSASPLSLFLQLLSGIHQFLF